MPFDSCPLDPHPTLTQLSLEHALVPPVGDEVHSKVSQKVSMATNDNSGSASQRPSTYVSIASTLASTARVRHHCYTCTEYGPS